MGLALGHRSPAVEEQLTAYLPATSAITCMSNRSRFTSTSWEKWLGVLLRVATLFVGLTALAAVAIVAWQASRAAGTVVDAFSVPPAFAQAGITGEVVATDLTQKIAAISDIGQNNSLNSAQAIRNEGQDDIKVDIPETGVSLGQAWRYLRLWLGHEHHLSGNLRQTGDGRITLTVAVDGQQAISAEGAAADLGKLEQQAAEQVFADVDAINIVLYLRTQGRGQEAMAAAERGTLLANPPGKRADAYGLWASMTRNQLGDLPLALARAQIGLTIDPKVASNHREIMWAQYLMGHAEAWH